MEIKELYALLESRDEASLKEALTFLEGNEALKKQAEKRYLKFIQTRTKNSAATLAHINEAAFTEAEMGKLRKDLSPGVLDTISMYNLQNDDLVLIADFGGALVANHLDINAYLAQAKVFTDLDKFEQFVTKTENKLLQVLEEEVKIYNEGWFGEMYERFMGLKYEKISFDHVMDCGLNDSDLLNEYWIFLSLFLGKYDSLVVDVFQATGISIMPATFLMKSMPKVFIQEGNIDFPKDYPLLVERSIVCAGQYIYESVKAPDYALGSIILQNRYY